MAVNGNSSDQAPDSVINFNYPTSGGAVTIVPPIPPSRGCTNVQSRDHLGMMFAGRLYASDHDQSLTVCDAETGVHIPLADKGKVEFSPTFGRLGNTVSSATLADFSGTGYSDLAVSYGINGEDGNLLLFSGANADGSPNLHFGNSGNAQPEQTLVAMTTGDFNGDGRPEIAGLTRKYSGHPSIVIYTVAPATLAVTKAAEVTPSYAGEKGSILHYSITAGKFTDANHQQIVLTYCTDTGSVKMVAFDFAASSLQPIEQKIFTVPNAGSLGPEVWFGRIQVQAARFAWQSSYDQVAFEYSYPGATNFVDIYELNPNDLSLQQNPISILKPTRLSLRWQWATSITSSS